MDDWKLSTEAMISEERTFKRPLKSIVLVQKVSKDYAAIKSVIEKNMVKTFSKMYFIKPKANEIECESIELCYDSFLIASTKYRIEYYQNKKYHIDLDENVDEVIVFDHSIKPRDSSEKSIIGNKSRKEIVIEGKERVNYESTGQFTINRKGRIIDREGLPSAACEPDPVKFLDKYDTNVRHPEVYMWDILKKAAVKRPANVSEVINEKFQVTEQVLVYTPIYEARCRNLNSYEIKIIPVSGVTGKIFTL
jgi:hypothetical protein